MKLINTYVDQFYFMPPQGLDDDAICYAAEQFTGKDGIYMMSTIAKMAIKSVSISDNLNLDLSIRIGEVDKSCKFDLAKNYFRFISCPEQFNNDLESFRSACQTWMDDRLRVTIIGDGTCLDLQCPVGGAIFADLAKRRNHEPVDLYRFRLTPWQILNDCVNPVVFKNRIVYAGKSDGSKAERVRNHNQWRRIHLECGAELQCAVYFLRLKSEVITINGDHQERSAIFDIRPNEILSINEMYLINTLKPRLNTNHRTVTPTTLIPVVKKAKKMGYQGIRLEIDLDGQMGSFDLPGYGTQNSIRSSFPFIKNLKGSGVVFQQAAEPDAFGAG